MQVQYFKSAWGDVKNSPGWFGKLCLLALLNFIPVFGQVVTLAYLYGWAREIAWGKHEPLPSGIFSNDDGKFWRRGWFAFVLAFVFMLIPYIVMSLGQYWHGLGYKVSYEYAFNGWFMPIKQEVLEVDNPLLVGFGAFLQIVAVVGFVAMAVFSLIGVMRVSIYDRLSSGFQFNKIWKMLAHDASGIAKIVGMALLVGLVLAVVVSIIAFVLLLIVVMVGIASLVDAGFVVTSDIVQSVIMQFPNMPAANVVQVVLSVGVIGLLSLLIGSFCSLLAIVFVQMLVVRAMGYWTMQFDVARWGGQDDPMPFELHDEKQASAKPPLA